MNLDVVTTEQEPARRVLQRRSLRLSAPRAAQLIRDAIAAGGEMWVSGSGQSMHPTVHHADLVLVGPVGDTVQRGDIVLVPLGPRLMLHRVVVVQRSMVLTRGDSRQRNDAPTPRRDIVARALAVRRDDRVTPLVLTTRFGVAALFRFFRREARRRVGGGLMTVRGRLRFQRRDT